MGREYEVPNTEWFRGALPSPEAFRASDYEFDDQAVLRALKRLGTEPRAEIAIVGTLADFNEYQRPEVENGSVRHFLPVLPSRKSLEKHARYEQQLAILDHNKKTALELLNVASYYNYRASRIDTESKIVGNVIAGLTVYSGSSYLSIAGSEAMYNEPYSGIAISAGLGYITYKYLKGSIKKLNEKQKLENPDYSQKQKMAAALVAQEGPFVVPATRSVNYRQNYN